MIKIGIDCRPLTMKPTGVSKYLADAIRAIHKFAPNIDMYLFSPKQFDRNTIELKGERIHVIVCPLTGLNKYIVWFNTMFVRQCIKYKIDYIWFPFPDRPLYLPRKFKTIVTVHDVVNLEYKDTQRESKISFYRNYMTKKGIEKADYLWANSKYTKRKIEQYYTHRHSQEIFVAFSCSNDFHRIELSSDEINKLKSKYGISEKFLLFVGTLEPRKNLSFLLSVMEELHKELPLLKLIVVGGRGWKNSDIFNIVNRDGYPKDCIEFTDYIDTDTLVKFYNMADCYVSTALNEGFGLPQLEAMRCGCRVVTAHNSAMIEVVEGRGVTVREYDKNIWKETIIKSLNSPKPDYDLSEYDWQNVITRLCRYLNLNNI